VTHYRGEGWEKVRNILASAIVSTSFSFKYCQGPILWSSVEYFEPPSKINQGLETWFKWYSDFLASMKP
jgi:hypothetical protein